MKWSELIRLFSHWSIQAFKHSRIVALQDYLAVILWTPLFFSHSNIQAFTHSSIHAFKHSRIQAFTHSSIQKRITWQWSFELRFEKENRISRCRVILVFYFSIPYANEFAKRSLNKKPFAFQRRVFFYSWPRQDCLRLPDKAPLWKSKRRKIKKASFMI